MSFSDSAYCRVARHCPDALKLLSNNGHLCTHAGSRTCRLDTGVPASDNNDIKTGLFLFHVKHLFSDAKPGKNFSQHLFYINSARQSPEGR